MIIGIGFYFLGGYGGKLKGVMRKTQNEIISVEQLPIIKERLSEISNEIDRQIAYVNSLECTEETISEIKTARATLNKNFNEIEVRRKEVKNAIMSPYEKFESIYKEYISNKYRNADLTLKNKIQNIEDQIKDRKRVELEKYFQEYALSKDIKFKLTLEDGNIPIRLSDSLKSLQDKVRIFLDKVSDDIATINRLPNASQILMEYRRTLNCQQAISNIENWNKEMQENIPINDNKPIIEEE